MLQISTFSRLYFVLLALVPMVACSAAHHLETQGVDAGDIEVIDDIIVAPVAAHDITPDTPELDEPDISLEPAPICAGFTESSRTGKLAAPQISEASGLAASWAHEGLLWTHNDSGDSARVFLIRPDGALVAEVHLRGVENAVDWEDIAVAPCAPRAAQTCVFVADTGDNLRARESVVIYRFVEPELPAAHRQDLEHEQTSITLDIEDVRAIWFDYPDGPRDVETLMVHPQSSAIYLVEKNPTSLAPVFRVPAEEASAQEPARALEIATLELEGRSSLFAMITAGDIAPNGREFTVRTYLESYTYCAPELDSENNSEDNFEDVFKLSPTRNALPAMSQAEALGYDRSGASIWVTSEGVHAPILRVERAAH